MYNERIEEQSQTEEQCQRFRTTDLIYNLLQKVKPLYDHYFKAYMDFDSDDPDDDPELETIEGQFHAIDYAYGIIFRYYMDISVHESKGGSVNWKRTCEIIMGTLAKCEQSARLNQYTEGAQLYSEVYRIVSDAWTIETNRLNRENR